MIKILIAIDSENIVSKKYKELVLINKNITT
jgi:hypothetical protein